MLITLDKPKQMKISDNILLPGTGKQLEFLHSNFEIENKKILVIGAGSEVIAKALSIRTDIPVEFIVEDYESFMQTNLNLGDEKNINVSLMSFESTDFEEKSFDLVYAQASISSIDRKLIVKEIKRIIKDDGFLCVGEIFKSRSSVPPVVDNLFESSGLAPLLIDELEKYYTDRNFKLIAEKDLSDTLAEYYSQSSQLLSKSKGKLPENELSYFKKILNKISHESNLYLKHGGDKYWGFKVMLLQKDTK